MAKTSVKFTNGEPYASPVASNSLNIEHVLKHPYLQRCTEKLCFYLHGRPNTFEYILVLQM